MNISEKVVIVIGGLGLLGSQIVKTLHDANAVVIIADIKESEKHDTNYYYINTGDENSIKNVITLVSEKYNKIDCVINSSYPRNRNYGRKLEDVEFSDFCENVNLHLGGYFLVCKLFAQFFEKQGYGNIINISSVYATKTPDFGLYAGTTMTMPIEYAVVKAGINNMNRYLTNYYKHKSIRFNTVSPGGILDKQPSEFVDKYNSKCSSGGMLQTTDISGTILFLVSELSNSITGQDIIVDNGFSLS